MPRRWRFLPPGLVPHGPQCGNAGFAAGRNCRPAVRAAGLEHPVRVSASTDVRLLSRRVSRSWFALAIAYPDLPDLAGFPMVMGR
jgi:hypothetical protein